ncbi:DUF805 domain-containing protein [Bengtsoniella intestinalis]|uniref:DUF805 domain-containing protein n=1 Tax=Bengtsoniella intestinalis TaxID=3073143 RepID=UPI00391F9A27
MKENFQKNLGYYIDFWKNCLDFSGKIDRHTFWMTVLMCYIFNAIVFAVLDAIGITILGSIFTAACVLPEVSMGVRRLRDIGKAWPWIFLWFIPVIGWIWCVVLFCRKSA